MSEERTGTGLTFLGKLLSLVLIAGLIAAGVFLIKGRGTKAPGGDAHVAGDASHGDDAKARDWLHSQNDHIGGVPADRIRTVEGLVDVIQYLDAMRGHL